MSHFTNIERVQIIMERERDGKRMETIAQQHKCTTAIIGKIVSHYNRTGEISGTKSTGRPTCGVGCGGMVKYLVDTKVI